MREILFKAKRKDNGEWLIGGIIERDGKAYVVGISKRLIIDGIEVDANTICQYTGLTDKNGNKIWENDVVAFHHYEFGGFSGMDEYGFPILNHSKERVRNYAIEFVNTFCTYGLRFRNKSIHFPCKLSTLRMHDVEVIGNIFDNQELLKAGE